MGNSSGVPASEVLSLFDSSGAVLEPLQLPSDEELSIKLASLGVDATDVDKEGAERCWSIVMEKDFWRRNYTSHPNKRRVKTWLFVHEAFRTRATSLEGKAKAMQASVERAQQEKLSSTTQALQVSFQTLAAKIASHSSFEDSQLFKFFAENVPETEEALRNLEAEHQLESGLEERVSVAVKALSDAISQGPTEHGLGGTGEDGGEGKCGSGQEAAMAELAEEVQASVAAFKTNLEGHLEREERVLVGPWLNLSPALFKKFKGSLSLKYRIAY
ncbi:unnamed protein product [Choristocarpus tenellus]